MDKPVSPLRVFVVLTCAAALPAFGDQAPAMHWTYEGQHGPAHWASLDPDYEMCKLGKRQSPIETFIQKRDEARRRARPHKE